MATIKGTNNTDTLVGTYEDDVLRGKRGADTLVASDGTDILWGGRGKDTFVFTVTPENLDEAFTVIQDFNSAKDKIVGITERFDGAFEGFDYNPSTEALNFFHSGAIGQVFQVGTLVGVSTLPNDTFLTA